ncbi:MAG: DUF3006 domain-containing protein [Oscillospiraceae bacterium]|nr:DUF3006 domain-containing protein [Oscillospiraceae bacterium]
MFMTIERFEGDKVILEIGKEYRLTGPKSDMPEGACEGDIVEYVESEGKFILHKLLTEVRRETMKQMQDKLFEHRSEED